MAEHQAERALTRRSLFVGLSLALIWTLAACYLAIFSTIYRYQLLMVLGFAGILTIFLLQFPRLYLSTLIVCWGGTAWLAWINSTPQQQELLVGGMLRSLPVLGLLVLIGLLQWRRKMSRAESALVYAMVVLAIPWAISLKACLESGVTNLFDVWKRSEKQVYQWAREMPWWGPTLRPPEDQAEHEARILAGLAQSLMNRDVGLPREQLLQMPKTAFYYINHKEAFDQLAAMHPTHEPRQLEVYQARLTQLAGRIRWGRLRPASLIDLPVTKKQLEASLEVLRDRAPRWAALEAAVEGFARGSPDGSVPWHLWWRPMLYWTAMCSSYVAMLFGLLLMFRRRWIEHERLPLPWSQPALTAIRGEGANRRGCWVAWLLGVGICVPGILYASLELGVSGPIPMIPWAGNEGLLGGFDLTGLGLLYKTPLYLYWGPLILAMFLLFPADVLLTIVLTYVCVQMLGGSLLQWLGMDVGRAMLNNFFKWGVRSGGCAGLLIWGIFWNRRAIWNYLKSLVGRGSDADEEQRDELGRWLVGALFVVGLVGYVWLGLYATTWPMMLFLAFWVLVYCFAQVRQRAEGMLCTYENNITSHQLVSLQRDFLHEHPTLVGNPQYPQAVTTSAPWGSHWMQWGFAGQLKTYGPQNMLMEVFKVAHEVRANVRQIGIGIAIIMILVAVITPPLYVKLIYLYGFENTYQEGLTVYRGFTSWSERAISYGIHSTSRVYWFPGQSNWFREYENLIWTVVGIGIVGIMTYMRREYVWFPLSPVGFVLAAETVHTRLLPMSPNYAWFSFLLAWMIKKLVFRWLGVRYYNERLSPLILYALCGMIFGMLLYILKYVSLGKGFLA